MLCGHAIFKAFFKKPYETMMDRDLHGISLWTVHWRGFAAKSGFSNET
jgi:hypothetical protein